MNESIKPPVWFWVVSSIALLWNIMGAFAYLGQMFMTEEALQALPEDQQRLIESTPAWATAAFAVAVWAGVLGCVFLLMRKRWAYQTLILSFLGVLVQSINSYIVSDARNVYGAGELMLGVFVLFVALLLVLFARRGASQGWLS